MGIEAIPNVVSVVTATTAIAPMSRFILFSLRTREGCVSMVVDLRT
jgi:hypothetical protein